MQVGQRAMRESIGRNTSSEATNDTVVSAQLAAFHPAMLTTPSSTPQKVKGNDCPVDKQANIHLDDGVFLESVS
jgi:hypothetical protein